MGGRPDGKHKSTKKNGPVRKKAKAKKAHEDVVRGGMVGHLRLIIARRG